MIIAIDIDNTILKHNSLGYKIANLFPTGLSDRALRYKDVTMWNRHDDSLIARMITKFFRLNNIQNYSVDARFARMMRTIQSRGHQIILLSSRPDWNELNLILFELLDSMGIKNPKIVLECNNKIGYIKLNNIDILIDSSKRVLKLAKENGIKSYSIDNFCDHTLYCLEKNP